MLPQEIIRLKRSGNALNDEIISSFIRNFLEGKVSDYQMSAFLMATYFQGMTFNETIALTKAFIHSGTQNDLSSIAGIKVDKHSTGGVGDKISLIVVPIVAAAGVCVPMISGRGLGHTGGTLDKLESIPGFKTSLSIDQFISQLKSISAAIIGQSDMMVPADKKIYAIRDVTSTIEILSFIIASILSKKIASGTNALILDVKTGNGAFMSSLDDAKELAKSLVQVAEHFELNTSGFVTDMNEPLGYAIGNWIEVVEAVDCLKGFNVSDVLEVSVTLSGAMIYSGKKSSSFQEGITIAREMISSGLAYQKFIEIVHAQHGNTYYIENTLAYPNPKFMVDVHAASTGYVESMNSRTLGMIAIELGAGRKLMTDTIDYTAGIILRKKCGDRVEDGDTLCTLCSSTVESLFDFKKRAEGVYTLSLDEVHVGSRIKFYFDRDGFYPWEEFGVC